MVCFIVVNCYYIVLLFWCIAVALYLIVFTIVKYCCFLFLLSVIILYGCDVVMIFYCSF